MVYHSRNAYNINVVLSGNVSDASSVVNHGWSINILQCYEHKWLIILLDFPIIKRPKHFQQGKD